MPANIGHILIANYAYKKLNIERPDIGEFIVNKNNHLYLGSIGPDLPSYKNTNLIKTALNQLLVRPFVDKNNPQEEDASFFFHSTRPNLFPYYLMETNLAFADLKGDDLIKKDFNLAVFVFTLGYVSHIAADQVIHRLVREIVGPYYRNIDVSKNHGECEVHQDIFLFYNLYPTRKYDKFIQKSLINIEKAGFDYEQFCNLMSLAISKAGYFNIKKSDIDSWLDGIKLVFDLMDEVGPYVSAFKNYEKNKDNLKELSLYKKYFRNDEIKFDYMEYFYKAVDLSVIYMKEIIRLWDTPDFSYQSFVDYQKVVQPDDLTSPFKKEY